MDKAKPKEVIEAEYRSVEELKEKNKTMDAIHRGVCAKHGWHTGKQVKEKEYQEAIKSFMRATTGGNRC